MIATPEIVLRRESDTPWETSGGFRPGVMHYQAWETLGEDGTVLCRSFNCRHEDGMFAPRHHHNFDQIRFVLDGEAQYRDDAYGAGTYAYFPETAYYGPESHKGTRQIVMQFPGPSRGKLFSNVDTFRATEELMASGVDFQPDFCVLPNGKRMDSIEACWEHLAGKKIEYAPARFEDPVFVHTAAFDWQPSGIDGVSVKHLGYMNEAGPNALLARIEPGASTPAGQLGCIQARFVIEGEVQIQGEPYAPVSYAFYPANVPYPATESPKGATLLVVQLQGPDGTPPPLLAL